MFDSLIKYLEINIELIKLDVKEMVAKMIVDVIKLIVVGFLASMALIFLSVSLGLWLGEATGSMIQGLGIVGGLYLMAAVVFVAARKKLRMAFQRVVSKYIPDNQQLINELTQKDEKSEH